MILNFMDAKDVTPKPPVWAGKKTIVMTEQQMLGLLLGLPDVQLTGCELKGKHDAFLRIESTIVSATCPTCGALCPHRHSLNEAVLIRDLDVWGRRCWLSHRPQRFRCERCNKLFNERVLWRNLGYNYTVRYEEYIYQRVQQESVLAVAHAEGMSEGIIRGIIRRKKGHEHSVYNFHDHGVPVQA